MAVRVAVLVVCVAAVVVLAGRRADAGGCAQARGQAFALTFGAAPGAPVAPLVRRLRAQCHDVDDLAGAAASLVVGGRGAEGLALAREATRRGPEVFSAWVALEAALRRRDPRAGRRAEARARALNPRWSGPAPLPAPPAAAGP